MNVLTARIGSLLFAWDGEHVGIAVVVGDEQLQALVGPIDDDDQHVGDRFSVTGGLRRKRPSKYPFDDLVVGKTCEVRGKRASIYCAVQRSSRLGQRKFVTRQLDGDWIAVTRLA